MLTFLLNVVKEEHLLSPPLAVLFLHRFFRGFTFVICGDIGFLSLNAPSTSCTSLISPADLSLCCTLSGSLSANSNQMTSPSCLSLGS